MVNKDGSTVSKVTKNFKMPCTFDEFKRRCATQGYTDVRDQTVEKTPYGVYALFVKTATGAKVKCEIKSNRYTLGYGLNKNVPVLRDYLRENTGFECGEGSKFFNIDYVGKPSVDTIFADFFTLVDAVKDIDGIVSAQRGQARKVFTREVAEKNIFEKIAKRYRHAIDNEDQDLLDVARGLLSGDSIDHLITIGESVRRTPSDTYREHIVPCILIHNQAIELTLSGAPYTQVAQMIKENLAIVLITPAEAKTMDVKLGLRTTMPDGWEFGDSVFARLDAAKIKRK